MDYAAICRAAEARGLAPRGAFHPSPSDGVPSLEDGRAVGTLMLVGVVGRSCWHAFRAADEFGQDAHPLDRWSRRVVTECAEVLGAMPLFPFGGPPYMPFQRWAQRAESVYPSPIGPLIHPDYGLWHAYRGALAFPGHLELPPAEPRPSPCVSCTDRPCLSTCPVGAFSSDGYDVPACIAHIASPAGDDCLHGGCRARRACPVATDHQYEPAQMHFHMAAFLAANQASSD